jgi:hypothetical protein
MTKLEGHAQWKAVMPALRQGTIGPRSRPSEIAAREFKGIIARCALLLFRALPDHAGKSLQRHQRLAGIGPFLQLLDRDVVERLPAGALREQRAQISGVPQFEQKLRVVLDALSS